MSCLERCADCKFPVGKLVGGRGPEDSSFVIIGESPGKNEARLEEPFVGDSGEVLEAVLAQHPKGSYPEPYITNAFKCYPKGKEAEDLHGATAACQRHLIEELNRHPRRVILAMGNAALWSVTNNFGLRITQERGKLFKTDQANVGVVASVHPAYLMRGQGSIRQFKADVDYAIRLAKGEKPRNPGRAGYKILHTEEDVLRFCQRIRQAGFKYLAADAETTGFDHISDEILCLGFSIGEDETFIVPDYNLKAVRHIFRMRERNGVRIIWHNGKFDVKFFLIRGYDDCRVDEDTMLLSYTLDEIGGIHDLETVASDWCGSPNWKAILNSYLPDKKSNYGDIPRPVLYWYLAQDLKNTFDIFQILRPKVKANWLLERQYTKTLIPASDYLAEVEMNGMWVDTKRVQRNVRRMENRIAWKKRHIYRLCMRHVGHGINPNSPTQLGAVLFDELGFKAKVRSTNIKILESLPEHPIVVAIKQYRKIFKGYSTYVKSITAHIKVDGKIHQTFLLHGTRTGRLAARNPNTQNIPRDPVIRGQIHAQQERIFCETDLNQAELRSLAELSGDEEMCRIYNTEGMSIHEEIRAFIWGNTSDWSEKEVDDFLIKFYLTHATRYDEFGADRILGEQKMRAKAVNFGIVYGREAPSLAEEFGIPILEAQEWINKWFRRFPQAKEFIERCRRAPYEGKSIATVFGYHKRFGIVNQQILKSLQNEAANFPHQSIASTICLHGGMAAREILRDVYDTRSVNPVHDSLLHDCPDDREIVLKVAEVVEQKMEEVPRLWGFNKVPFLAESKIGYRWGSLQDKHKWMKAHNISAEGSYAH